MPLELELWVRRARQGMWAQGATRDGGAASRRTLQLRRKSRRKGRGCGVAPHAPIVRRKSCDMRVLELDDRELRPDASQGPDVLALATPIKDSCRLLDCVRPQRPSVMSGS